MSIAEDVGYLAGYFIKAPLWLDVTHQWLHRQTCYLTQYNWFKFKKKDSVCWSEQNNLQVNVLLWRKCLITSNGFSCIWLPNRNEQKWDVMMSVLLHQSWFTHLFAHPGEGTIWHIYADYTCSSNRWDINLQTVLSTIVFLFARLHFKLKFIHHNSKLWVIYRWKRVTFSSSAFELCVCLCVWSCFCIGVCKSWYVDNTSLLSLKFTLELNVNTVQTRLFGWTQT